MRKPKHIDAAKAIQLYICTIMKRVLFTFFICLVIQPLTAQNSISFKNIEAFELGDDPDKFSGKLTDITDPADSSLKRYKIQAFEYNAGSKQPVIIAGVPFTSTWLEYAYGTTLSRITFSVSLGFNKDSVLYLADSSAVYRERLKKYINTALQIKSEDEITDLTEPVTVKIISSSWEKNERKFNDQTKLYDWGNVYRLTVAESVIYNEKKKVTEKWLQLTLANFKYYITEIINGKLREY